MNLEQTAASLLVQFPTGQLKDLEKQERLLERFGQIAFAGLGVALVGGVGVVIYLIVTKMILTASNFWSGILLVAFTLFAGLALAYVFLAELIKENRTKVSPRFRGSAIESPDNIGALGAGHFEPSLSVIEDTTELLVPEKRTKKLDESS